jgi:aspergillopepsin I
MWHLPRAIAHEYWAKVPGAALHPALNAWIFPCASELPAMSIMVSGRRITVPGISMHYQNINGVLCYGGIQEDFISPSLQLSIFGNVFMKGLFIIFESPDNGTARLGFAQSS